MTTRRTFITAGTAALGGMAAGGPIQALFASTAHAAASDYGPLFPTIDPTTGLDSLLLPAGFSYMSIGWARDPLDSPGYGQIPVHHDGMHCFPVAGHPNRVRLIRNHEVSSEPYGPKGVFADAPSAVYDEQAASGGCTILEFDVSTGEEIRTWSGLAGTIANCAGGVTPWGTWLTCEETTSRKSTSPTGRLKDHGYVFEVSPAKNNTSTAEPLVAMGRFQHEAAAVDPGTGYVYLTEDARPRDNCGFYQFRPNHPHQLKLGGTLWMMKIGGVTNFNSIQDQGYTYPLPVEWVPITDPDPIVGAPTPWEQGMAQGGAQFYSLEGAVWGDDRVYFTNQRARIYAYEPATGLLHQVVADNPDPPDNVGTILDGTDNLGLSPSGVLIGCEDGAGSQSIKGITPEGAVFEFCRNNLVLNGQKNGFVRDYRDTDLAGACFSPDGKWMFFNIYDPGLTVAITGPWENGPFATSTAPPTKRDVSLPMPMLPIAGAAALGGMVALRNRGASGGPVIA